MNDSHSYEALIKFLEYASDHGLMKAPTARGYRVAAVKVQDELTEQEARDVREIDLDLLFQRFVNRNKVEVAPRTLQVYRRRLATAIDEFVAWRADPVGYRPQIGSRRPRSEPDAVGTGKSPRARNPRVGEEPDYGPEPLAATPSSSMLTIPFPLRADFVVSLQVPRDLTLREADRLAAFVRTLAVDFGVE